MKRIFVSGVCFFVIFSVAAGVYLCESTVHPQRRPLDAKSKEKALSVAGMLGADLEAVEITASDGVTLRGWFFHLKNGNGSSVFLIHGQADSRAGMVSYAKVFLRHGYDVLIPDMRAHGESEGKLATYGLLESEDIHRWMNRLFEKWNPGCVFALGESMGGAILLQSLRKEPRFCAVVAESSFSSFRSIAYDRVGQVFGTGPWLAQTVARPIVESAFVTAQARYGMDFNLASPEEVAATTRIPILLIHGLKDDSIPPHHSRQIFERNPQVIQLWEIPNAGHCGALGRKPEQFEKRVCGFFNHAVLQ